MISILSRTAKAMLFAIAAGLAAPALAEATTPAAAPVVEDFSLGSADAKVKIVEYASYTCPHCADFHAANFAKLKAEYIDTGKVQFTLREVYFDRYGLWAAMVARCGGDLKYFFIHDILFDTQREWAASDDPNTVVENLKKIARTAGMEDATVDACLKDTAMAQALVARFQTNMEADGVEGTPTIFINGTKYSNMDYADLKALIDTELAK
jgi:protein-disulfide isomerase